MHTNKSFIRRLIVFTVLGGFVLAAAGCSSGHSGGCGAYGNPKTPGINSERLAE